MSLLSSNQPEADSKNPWRRLFWSEWDQQVLEDTQEFDGELIAAYAEGNVTGEEQREAERVLAGSPAALDMLVTLRSQIAESHQALGSNPWRQLFGSDWDQQVLDDVQEFDGDLIAAYAEGNVTDEERSEAERILANSPAALDTLVMLRGQTAGNRQSVKEESESELPLDEPSAESSPIRVTVPTTLAESGRSDGTSTRSRSRFQSLATAASVAIAVGAIGWSLVQKSETSRLNHQVAALDQQYVNQVMALSVVQQERITATGASTLPPYVAGSTSPRLLELAISESGLAARGPSDNDPPEVKGAKKATLSSATAVLDQWRQTTDESAPVGVLIAQASLEITLGELDSARSLTERLARRIGESAPEVRNLQALHLLALAETQPLSQAETTFAEARTMLESLTTEHPEFVTGWLNLALFLQRHEGPDAAVTREAWKRYLTVESRNELKHVIQSYRKKQTSN